MATGTLAADLKVNLRLKVKFHTTDRIRAVRYMGPYSFCMILAKVALLSMAL